MRRQRLHQVICLDLKQQLVDANSVLWWKQVAQPWAESQGRGAGSLYLLEGCGVTMALVGYPDFTKHSNLGDLIQVTGCHGDMALNRCSPLQTFLSAPRPFPRTQLLCVRQHLMLAQKASQLLVSLPTRTPPLAHALLILCPCLNVQKMLSHVLWPAMKDDVP